MGHQLTVEVLDSDGDPVKGAREKIDIKGIWKGGTVEEFTDSSGHAEFETAEDYEESRELSIYVRGPSFGPYRVGGGTYTVQLE